MFDREELIGWAEDMFPLEPVTVTPVTRNTMASAVGAPKPMKARYESITASYQQALNISLETRAATFTFFVPKDGSYSFHDLPIVGEIITRQDGSEWTAIREDRVVIDVLKSLVCTWNPARSSR